MKIDLNIKALRFKYYVKYILYIWGPSRVPWGGLSIFTLPHVWGGGGHVGVDWPLLYPTAWDPTAQSVNRMLWNVEDKRE